MFKSNKIFKSIKPIAAIATLALIDAHAHAVQPILRQQTQMWHAATM